MAVLKPEVKVFGLRGGAGEDIMMDLTEKKNDTSRLVSSKVATP